MTSDSLINVSDRYVDLDSIKDEIQKHPKAGNSYRNLSPVTVLPQERGT
jgi:uncharacterized LabA/DUF88 family protein